MLALLGCTSTPAELPPGVTAPTLTDLHSVEDLRSRFNEDDGVPRLLLLVSPT